MLIDGTLTVLFTPSQVMGCAAFRVAVCVIYLHVVYSWGLVHYCCCVLSWSISLTTFLVVIMCFVFVLVGRPTVR